MFCPPGGLHNTYCSKRTDEPDTGYFQCYVQDTCRAQSLIIFGVAQSCNHKPVTADINNDRKYPGFRKVYNRIYIFLSIIFFEKVFKLRKPCHGELLFRMRTKNFHKGCQQQNSVGRNTSFFYPFRAGFFQDNMAIACKSR